MSTSLDVGSIASDAGIALLRHVNDWLVRSNHPDLTPRQFSILLAANTESEAKGVRELSAMLNISKPAVTRALDRLQGLGLARRRRDPKDGRLVYVDKTPKGTDFLRAVAQTIKGAGGAN